MHRTLIASLIFVLCAASSCSNSRVKEDASLGKYFTERGVRGTFSLLSNNTGDFTVYNLERYRDSAYTPGSSFHLPLTLIGLQTGILPSGTDAESALRSGQAAFFGDLARRIGQDTLQFWMDSLAYGNKRIRGPLDTFWRDGSLTITPDEQLGLVKRLYFNELPFHRINGEAVKRAMLVEDKPQYKLHYLSGQAGPDPQRRRALGWTLGWIEENRHPYFFVLNLESPDPGADLSRTQPEMLRGILTQLGFFQGAK